MEDSDDKLLDGTAGIAQHFGLPQRTVQHWIENHGLPVVRVGRRIYGRVAAVREWLDGQARRDVEGVDNDD